MSDLQFPVMETESVKLHSSFLLVCDSCQDELMRLICSSSGVGSPEGRLLPDAGRHAGVGGGGFGRSSGSAGASD